MKSIERVLAAVTGKQTDRTPVIPQVFGYTAVCAGISIRDYVQNGDKLAESQIGALDRHKSDAVFAISDVNIETEVLGSVLKYPVDDYPYVQSHAFSRRTNLDTVSIPDPLCAGRMPQILRALEILRREVGNEVLVVGGVLGPMTLVIQLLGMEAALYLAIDDPDAFEKILDFATGVSVQFGVAQIDHGAHLPLLFDPGSSPDVIPPSFFREFISPRLSRMFAQFTAHGAAAGWLHIVGPIMSILPYCTSSGANIINFDYCVEPRAIMDACPATCLDGNIKPLDFSEALPEAIFKEACRLRDCFAGRGGFILSSGCEIPLASNPENIDALVAASRGPRNNQCYDR